MRPRCPQEGGGDENRFDLTWGHGNLESEGYNFYISAEYQKQDALWARDRDFPFNTQNLQRICGDSRQLHDESQLERRHRGAAEHRERHRRLDGFGTMVSVPGVALVRPVAAGAAAR